MVDLLVCLIMVCGGYIPGALRCQSGDLVIPSMKIKSRKMVKIPFHWKERFMVKILVFDGLIGHRISISLGVDMAEEHR